MYKVKSNQKQLSIYLHQCHCKIKESFIDQPQFTLFPVDPYVHVQSCVASTWAYKFCNLRD